MDKEMSQQTNVDSMELLQHFTNSTKALSEKVESKNAAITSLDIVTAVYYYRSYPEVNGFIERFLSNSTDYFLLQWVRSTWDRFSLMTDGELSELVIKEVGIISNLEEEIA